jgi:hypothetical protein
MVGMDNDFGREEPVDAAEPHVRKAMALAQQLHHQRAHVAHLLLAIALTRYGADLFDRHKLVVKDVRESCWRQLEKEAFTLDPPLEVMPDDGFNQLLIYAANFANRGTLQSDHILRALTDVKLVTQFASLIQKAPQPGDTHEIVSRTKVQLDEELPEIKGRLDRIETTQVVTMKKIDVLQENVGDGNSDGNLHTAADRLKKRMTNVKTWLLIASAIIITALIVHIILTR